MSIFDEVMTADAKPEAPAKPAESAADAPAEQAKASGNGDGRSNSWETKNFASVDAAASEGWVPVAKFAWELTSSAFMAAVKDGKKPTHNEVQVLPVQVMASARNTSWDFPICNAVIADDNSENGVYVHMESGLKAWESRPEPGTGPKPLDPEKVMVRYAKRRELAAKYAALLSKSEKQLTRISKSTAEALEYYDSVRENEEASKVIPDEDDE